MFLNKKLGQHFLVDPSVLRVMATTIPARPGLVTLEIGPGTGVLTEALHAQGHEIVAIEKDARFLPALTERFKGRSIRLLQGDATTMDWAMAVDGLASHEHRSWQLISNLPYAITSWVLRQALYLPRPADEVLVLIQREVAERALGQERTSLLSLMIAWSTSEARLIRTVPPEAFDPPPKVHSAILHLVTMPWPEREKRWGKDPEKMMDVAHVGFAHPRKKLIRNLEARYPKEKLQSIFQEQSLDENVRAEALSAEQWATLCCSLLS